VPISALLIFQVIDKKGVNGILFSYVISIDIHKVCYLLRYIYYV